MGAVTYQLLVSKPTFLDSLKDFTGWVRARGAFIRDPFPYQILRFQTGRGTSYAYRPEPEAEYVTLFFEAAEAWERYIMGSGWSAGDWYPAPLIEDRLRTKRRKGRRRGGAIVTIDTGSDSPPSGMGKVSQLLARDGDKCFFCGLSMTHKTTSIEHLVAKSLGGSNALSNLALAHKNCNSLAGSLRLDKKHALRELMHVGYEPKEALKIVTTGVVPDDSPRQIMQPTGRIGHGLALTL